MHRVSAIQALDLWSDLLEAYHNVNGFGGDTAEIYLYRLMPRAPVVEASPNSNFGIAAIRDLALSANTSLFNLIEYFLKDHEATITLDGRPFGPWLKESTQDHRWHVQVISKQREAVVSLGKKQGDADGRPGL